MEGEEVLVVVKASYRCICVSFVMCVHVQHLNEIMCMARDSGPIEHEQAKDNFLCYMGGGIKCSEFDP